MKIPTHETVYGTAQRLAEQGIPSFPCMYGKKKPAIPGGFKAATTDQNRIRQWYNGGKRNLAIPTGEVSGLVVIDNDCYKAGAENSLSELLAKYGPTPETFTVRTRAGGYQKYYKYPQGSDIRNSAGEIATGIDVRGEGGYVVAPPSWVDEDENGPAGYYEVVNDAPVAELPPAWVKALQATNKQRKKKRDSADNGNQGICEFLSGFTLPAMIPKGKRSNTLIKYAGHLQGHGTPQRSVETALLDANKARCEPPLDDEEVLSIARRYEGQGGATDTLTDASDWPVPKKIDNSLPPVPTFKEDLLPPVFRPWIGDIADRMQCPPDYLAVGAMVAVGAVVGNRVGIQPKQRDSGWTEVPNLWGAIVGRPGVMKTPALSQVLAPIKQLEAQTLAAFTATQAQYEYDKAVYEADKKKITEKIKKGTDVQPGQMPIAPVEPQPQRLLLNDATYQKLGQVLSGNPHGVLVYQDELSGLLQRLDSSGQEAARAFYLKAWNGLQGYTFDRIERGTVRIPRLCFSLLGGLQPAKLRQYLRAAVYGGQGDDGLAQRLQLLVYPDIAPGWKNVDRPPNQVAIAAAFDVFDRLHSLDPLTIGASPAYLDAIPVLKFDDKAQALFDRWRNALEHHLRDNDNHPALDSHISKHRKLVTALALLDHLIESKSGHIGVHSLERAMQWQIYLLAHAKRCYAAVTSASMDAAFDLSKHILRHALPNGFTLRDVYRKNWSMLGNVKEAAEAVEVLVDLKWLRPVRDERVSAQEGRPTVRHFINPRVREIS